MQYLTSIPCFPFAVYAAGLYLQNIDLDRVEKIIGQILSKQDMSIIETKKNYNIIMVRMLITAYILS